MDIYFPSTDFTVSKSLDTSKKQSVSEAEKQIPQLTRDAQRDINRLASSGINTDALQNELNSVIDENKNSQEKKAVLQHLKEVLRKIEDVMLELSGNALNRKSVKSLNVWKKQIENSAMKSLIR
jgi:molecular chaperone DnaK